jgi:hypothetical protein
VEYREFISKTNENVVPLCFWGSIILWLTILGRILDNKHREWLRLHIFVLKFIIEKSKSTKFHNFDARSLIKRKYNSDNDLHSNLGRGVASNPCYCENSRRNKSKENSQT